MPMMYIAVAKSLGYTAFRRALFTSITPNLEMGIDRKFKFSQLTVDLPQICAPYLDA
jgi:hypothetical protein